MSLSMREREDSEKREGRRREFSCEYIEVFFQVLVEFFSSLCVSDQMLTAFNKISKYFIPSPFR